MTAQKGSAFLLKIGDGGAPPVYETVAGLRTTQMSINGDTVVITHTPATPHPKETTCKHSTMCTIRSRWAAMPG